MVTTDELQRKIETLNREVESLKRGDLLLRTVETAFFERFGFQYIPKVTIGYGTPTANVSVPKKAGDIYIDVTNAKAYIAKSNTSYTDYLILN